MYLTHSSPIRSLEGYSSWTPRQHFIISWFQLIFGLPRILFFSLEVPFHKLLSPPIHLPTTQYDWPAQCHFLSDITQIISTIPVCFLVHLLLFLSFLLIFSILPCMLLTVLLNWFMSFLVRLEVSLHYIKVGLISLFHSFFSTSMFTFDLNSFLYLLYISQLSLTLLVISFSYLSCISISCRK